VVNSDGRPVGIVSRTDVLAVFDRSDEEVRKEIVDDVICTSSCKTLRGVEVLEPVVAEVGFGLSSPVGVLSGQEDPGRPLSR
jgi:CBS domain-containing protein